MTLTSILVMAKYHLNVALFKVRFSLYEKTMAYVRQLSKRLYISFRLMRRGKNREIVDGITNRYFGYKLYLQKKESKEAYHQLMEFISEWSATTGIPQWEARALINRDFNLDV